MMAALKTTVLIIFTVALIIFASTVAFGAKADDALALALTQNKALVQANADLAKAIAKLNAGNAQRADIASKQRKDASVVNDNNATAAQQAVNEQKEMAARVEAKTDAAKLSADYAARTSESNNTLLYGSLFANLLSFIVLVFNAVLKYMSDGRLLASQAALAANQREVGVKLDKASAVSDQIVANTNGMTLKIEELSHKRGFAEGTLKATLGKAGLSSTEEP